MSVDRIFADQDALDFAQGQGEFEQGGLYFIADTGRLVVGEGASEYRAVLTADNNASLLSLQTENEIATNDKFMVDGNKVVGNRESAVADPSGGAVVDTQARAAIAGWLARARNHGLLAT